MTDKGILACFFDSRRDAASGLRALRRETLGIRAAILHKPHAGRVHVSSFTHLDGIFAGALAGLMLAILSTYLPLPLPLGPQAWALLPLPAAMVAIGALAGWAIVTIFMPGVDRSVIRRFSRLLITGETLLIVQASASGMDHALTILRSRGEEHLAIFGLHPCHLNRLPQAEPLPREPLTSAQLATHARRLAATHRIETHDGKGEPLLTHLDGCEAVIRHVRVSLEEAARLEQGISPTSEWILDNAYIVLGHIDEIRRNLPTTFYHELPVLAGGMDQGTPRVYKLAVEMVSHTDSRIDADGISIFLDAYQSLSHLNIGELWALPIMLRIALIETVYNLGVLVDQHLHDREAADFWANRLMTAARHEPSRLPFLVARLAHEQAGAGSYFAYQITEHLYDEQAALAPVESWAEAKLGKPLAEILVEEQARQAANQVSIANAISSLRGLSLLDWREMFEKHSQVDPILRRDPAAIYERMDFNTRDRYRHAVETLARGSTLSQAQVAELAVQMAAQAQAAGDGLRRHIGYWLVSHGMKELQTRARSKLKTSERSLLWVYRHDTAVYLGGIACLTTALLAVSLGSAAFFGASAGVLIAVGILALLPASELAVQEVNYLLTRILPPRQLLKMYYEKTGLPDDCRTLVVTHTMLFGYQSIREQIHDLEVNSLANGDHNFIWALFADYCDAPHKTMPEDSCLLQGAIDGIEELNSRYGPGRFFLFCRERTWTDTEQSWICWERKRGKLEELNRLICNHGPADFVRVGDPDDLRKVRYVITLDADTRLPRGSARRMVESISHPLNAPCVSPDGRVVTDGYTVIQPRGSTSLPSATATTFARLFSDSTGSDPYCQTVSDAYQDLSGEGIYQGKGIYDPRAFYRVLDNYFPEQSVLSHDLVEGIHVRTGVVTDIEMLEDFPPTYLAYAAREHRWIRGDWQIAEYCLPYARYVSKDPADHEELTWAKNPLRLLNRWKVFDNLRRSLVPPLAIIMLVTAWLLNPAAAGVFSIMIALLYLAAPTAEVISWATARPSRRPTVHWRQFGRQVAHALISIALLPHQAVLCVDAIARALWSRLVSGRHLLQWTTTQLANLQTANHVRWFLLRLGIVSLSTIVVALAVARLDPHAWPAAAMFLLLWALSPIVGWSMNRMPVDRSVRQHLEPEDRRLVRVLSRLTWRYFDDFLAPASNYLPPDNYQVGPQTQTASLAPTPQRVELAMRTSPTNIGLAILAGMTAHDLGHVSVRSMTDRCEHIFDAIDKLERFEGHLLNWYDIATLQPLLPRYVSTVDSGNLRGSLWTFSQGLREIADEPMITPAALEALADVLQILRQHLETTGLKDTTRHAVGILDEIFRDPPSTAIEIIGRLRLAAGPAKTLGEAVRLDAPDDGQAAYWADQLCRQTQDWVSIIDDYLIWIEELARQSDTSLHALGPDAVAGKAAVITKAPSLRALSEGFRWAGQLSDQATDEQPLAPAPAQPWLHLLAEGRHNATELLGRVDSLAIRSEELAAGMNMEFLYDAVRRLFAVGYNVSDGKRDDSFYDLLASEARLAGLIAIASGEVPTEHWLTLARPFGSVHGRRVMLSWSGTMFEYLMPLLLVRSFPNSLLDLACNNAVRVQEHYGRRRHVPWGVSEAAFSALDMHQIYQYKAFGVPGLGLKRGLEEELVVTPYASALAASIDPTSALTNFRRLIRMGMLGEYGFYESVDFGHTHRGDGQNGIIVHAFMAHHQGMILLALGNLLCGQPMPRRFHSDARVRATEPLLYERIPMEAPLAAVPARDRVPARLLGIAPGRPAGRFNTPHTATPKTSIHSNGRLAVMVTNAGGGYTRWKDFDITRWRPDATRDDRGSFIYLKDAGSGLTWSAAFHPVRRESDRYSVHFSVDHAEFRRSDDGIETITEIVVSPPDDVEIRRLTIVNRSEQTRHIEITSYVELALASHASDSAHPAFSKMFVQTEALAPKGILLAWRRPRSHEDPPIWAAHMIVGEGKIRLDEYETSRSAFIGRGRSTANPAAMDGPLSNSTGTVLDPIFAIRREITLLPGQRTQMSILLAAGESRQAVIALAEKYRDLPAAARAFEVSWSRAQLERRHLRIQPEDAQRFQQLASFLIYPSNMLRPPSSRLRQNKLGQRGLWAIGISGDLPICVITIGEDRDIEPVREVLQAHSYWRMHGLQADLVVLNERFGGYAAPLQDRLMRLIQGHAMLTGMDRPGGVFLRNVDQLPKPEVALLMAAAHVVLVATRGTLAQQLSLPRQTVEISGPLELPLSRQEEPSPPLPFLELPYFNGLGGFTPDGHEYAIYLGPSDVTPAPWVNVMANPHFGQLVTDSGGGFAWSINSQSNRLTEWSNDPVCDPPAEAIYIRDEDSGIFWTPTPLPIRELDAYRVRHGAGYTIFEHNSHAIGQELLTFVPVDDAGGSPIRVQRLRLENRSSRKRRLTVTFYTEWTLGQLREKMQMHVTSQFDALNQMLFARNAFSPDAPAQVAFAATSPSPGSYSANRTLFLGRNGSLASPAAMSRAKLSGGGVGPALDPCAALQISIELDVGQSTEVVFLLGQCDTADHAARLVAQYRDPVRVEEAFQATRTWWDNLLGCVQVHTPVLSVNFLLNRWLPYQVLSCRLWARSAFYQSGGAIGFRDQLQDVLALLHARPQLAREQIILAAAHQYVEGDVLHWWHQQSEIGVRTRCSDDLVWLPYAVAQYVTLTGDDSLLTVHAPFIQGPPLEAGQAEALQTPARSPESGSILEHCIRALRHACTVGPHGLPLIGSGDWNDGLNRVGIGGQGESVWLAWFLASVLKDFANICAAAGRESLAQEYRRRAEDYALAADRTAWDGGWYRRAYCDDGAPLGAASSEECRIDSIAQSWAVISGQGDAGRAQQAIESALDNLVKPDPRLVLLFTPPFDKTPQDVGYIKGYPPGLRENGGQYTHAATWLAMALARMGDGRRAAALLQLINPIECTRELPAVDRFKTEPYVLTADIYSVPPHEGRGGWSWYTGAAGWTYRVWLEEILGIKRRGDRLYIQPSIPPEWDEYSVRYQYGKTTYEIHVANPQHVSGAMATIEIDGQPQEESFVPLHDDQAVHQISVLMGAPKESLSTI